MARPAEKHASSSRGKLAIGLVALVCIVAVALAFALFNLLADPNAKRWRSMSSEDGRFVYIADGQVASLTGVDVSDHNDYVDWRAVSQDGVDFAFIRVGNRGYTEGLLYDDGRFEENFTRARANGLAVGVYIFSQATTEQEAIDEADFVISRLRGRTLDLPVVFDWESISYADARTDNMTQAVLTQCALAFCKRIEAAGYQPMIYTNLKDSVLYDLDRLSDYPIWYAQYGVEHPTVRFEMSVWQYTSSASVDGIDGSTDMSILFLDASKSVYESRLAAKG